MAKLVYRAAEFPTLELIAEDGEEISAEQALAWATFRLMLSVDYAGVAVNRLADELPMMTG